MHYLHSKMAFNEANVDNRLRFPIRGRVIVFTTSKVVEYLDDSLRHSYPLYSVDAMPSGKGLAFMVELNGFLTFDADCEVRITPELNPFKAIYYDPAAFSLVRPSDGISITSLRSQFVENMMDSYVEVTLGYSDGSTTTVVMYPLDQLNAASFNAAVQSTFRTGSVWRGPSHYPGFTSQHSDL